eukprot:15441259-Alexandrium_andersonii.AAC.1
MQSEFKRATQEFRRTAILGLGCSSELGPSTSEARQQGNGSSRGHHPPGGLNTELGSRAVWSSGGD